MDNAIRATKPGGYIILAYVTIYAHLRDMARGDPSRLKREWSFYQTYLFSGKYTRRSNNESFHIVPKNVRGELTSFEGQVIVERMLSAEGFLGFHGAKGLANLSQDEIDRWVDVVMLSAGDEEALNCADHLLVVLRRC